MTRAILLLAPSGRPSWIGSVAPRGSSCALLESKILGVIQPI